MSSQAPLQKYPEPAPNGTSLSPRDVPKLAASNAEQVKANTTGVIPSSVSAEKRTAPVRTGVPTSDSAKTKIAPTENLNNAPAPEKTKEPVFDSSAHPIDLSQFNELQEVGSWNDSDRVTSLEETKDLLERATLLESYIKDRYIGDWFENTYIIIGTAMFSYIVAYLGGGLGWLFIVLAFTATAYRSSINRMERNATDDTSRETSIKKLETGVESLEWLNSFLVKFWIIYEPVLSETVIGVANQVLAGATPGFIESLSLKEFTLGTKPPRIDHVRSYPKTEPDVVVMDWKFSFTPNQTDDMTARQLKDKKNPKVELSVRVGKGVISKGLPILVEDMSFSGLMRVRIKLIPNFPHVKTVDVSFMEPPQFDFVLKPIGGDFGFDINIIPGLESFIKNMVNSNLGPMFYAPNAYQVNVEEMMATVASDAAIGVLAVTVFSANGLSGTDSSPDPYVTLALKDGIELARSDIKKGTKNPKWNETRYILVRNLSDALSLNIFDFNDFRKDKIIGSASFPLESLTSNPDQEGVSLELRKDSKSRGTVDCEFHWFPVLEGTTLPDGTIQPPPEMPTGIVKFTTHQCKDLDATKSLVGQLSPYSDLLMNDNLLHQSNSLKRTNNPVWDDSFEFLVTDKSKCNLSVRVKDSRGLATDPIIGTYQIKLETLLERLEQGNDWFNLTPSGRVRLSAVWKPTALKGISASKSYVEPIGSIRIHIQKAGEELRNLETIGKVDPYIRVFLNGFQRARTVAVPSTLAPVWDEVLYVPVQKTDQRLVIEAMDAENLGQDRTLGQFELNTGDFIKTNEKGEFVEYVDPKVRTGQFSVKKKGPKGSVLYTISFFPAVSVLNPDVAQDLRKEAEKRKADAAEAAAAPAADAEGAETPTSKDDDSKTLADAEAEAEAEKQLARDIPLDTLIKNESGIAAITFLDAKVFDSDLFIRVIVDNSPYPTYSTTKISQRSQALGETGELLIREVEWSQLIFQVTSKVIKPKKDEIISNFKVETLSLLKKSYYEPYKLNIKNGGEVVASATIRMRYFPLLMQLDPSESVNNMGVLTGEIVKADNVPAADRSGYSDPYTNIVLNGEKIFKTKIVKKTLNPVWNEPFSMEILSRTAAKFLIQVYDWDMGPSEDDFLGDVEVDLSKLEPLTPVTLTLPLNGKSGTITLNLLFKPSYVTRRIDSSGIGATFAGGGTKIVGGVVGGASTIVGGTIGGVVGGVGGVGHFVGGGIKGGASRLKAPFKRGSKSEASGQEVPAEYNLEAPGVIPAADSHSHQRSASSMSHASSGLAKGESAPGLINISYATGFAGCSAIQVKAFLAGKKEKEVYKTKGVKPSGNQFTLDESFSINSPPEAYYIFRIREHKSLGRTEELGEVNISLAEHATGQPVTLPVKDLGELTLLIDYPQNQT